ncbi:hypothetical protein GGD54_000352 [Rhizobium tropici]|uniref:Uncharacterized protein n=1 Tax=Rhizobium tropici TaxID=398 RepID=A0ABR6QSM2_RHITR|nr:hypothetical protein [Rhizobium tropici]MBB5590915.1 hypothetical protein [Rhizobium tropici]MBB6489876.1 hypothetical protein [Rhizobium tropici]
MQISTIAAIGGLGKSATASSSVSTVATRLS